MSELPLGWVEVKLGDHVYIAGRIGWRGLKADEYTEDGPILLAVPNLNYGDYVDFSKVNHISQARYDESPEIQIEVGDILLAKDGAGIGKLGYVAELPGPATVNSSMLVVRPNDGLLVQKYLFYYLKGPKFQDIALQRITGSATPHLFQKDIKQLSVLVPPHKEQQRIVTKLEQLLAQVDKVHERLERIPALMKLFRQSVLTAACSGRLTQDLRGNCVGQYMPSSWTTLSLSDLFSVQTGATPHRKNSAYYEGGTIPWVKTGEVYNCDITMTEEHITPLAIQETNAKVFPAGTILIAMYGEGRTRGQVGRLRIDASTNQACAALVNINNLPECTVDFVYIFCLGQYEEMRGASLGGNQPNLNLGIIKQWRLNLPPLDEQREIVRRVSALFNLADEIEVRYRCGKVHVDRLLQSLLAKAFRGELVPQDSNDEPASVLLERIQAANADHLIKTKQRMVVRKAQMPKVTLESIREMLLSLPDDNFTFEDIRQSAITDYETLKDIVFAMLDEERPLFKQVFDVETRSMRFERVKQ